MSKKIISIVLFVSLFCIVGFSFAANTAVINNPLTGVDNFQELLTQIAAGVGQIITYLGVIMLIVAGIFYLTSAGSPERIGVAKKALIYAIAGIAIGLAATAIVEVIKDIIGVTPPAT